MRHLFILYYKFILFHLRTFLPSKSIAHTIWVTVSSLFRAEALWYWFQSWEWPGAGSLGTHRCPVLCYSAHGFALWVSIFPPGEQTVSVLTVGALFGMEAAEGQPQEMEKRRKEQWCYFMLWCCVMKQHNIVVLMVWGYCTWEFFFFWPICRCAVFDVRLGYICLLFIPLRSLHVQYR